MNDYDVIVVGGGHAGIEAALASSRMGLNTLMLVFRREDIGQLSCNPAIGGVGKGQLVKEIDALGGEMARAADYSAMQFRMLNASKGAAVQSSRAQVDMGMYAQYMQEVIASSVNLHIKEEEAKVLLIERRRVRGVVTDVSGEIKASAVVLCPGTFLEGLIHIGLKHFESGRINEAASLGLADNLKKLGFNLMRFKTGTCPRLDRNSIDYGGLTAQNGDYPPNPFSCSAVLVKNKQMPCYITYTNERTHRIILDNLDRSPLYIGIIKATGVRYCPSIEDKIVKFKDKERHQIFLEPEGYASDEIYPNGISTSLPEDVQLDLIHSIAGLENARVLRFGYGIEHTVVEPTQLYPSLETKSIKGLYLAGQINGTTGYEEAAAQGLLAGINAALGIKGKDPLILDRATSYIGVLIDDLTTKGTSEPYRMFTSRVEYRLVLREDNADLRLRGIGYSLGLVSKADYDLTQKKQEAIKRGVAILRSTVVKPSPKINSLLALRGTPELKKTVTLEDVLKRPQVALKDLVDFGFLAPDFALHGLEIEVKYGGFIQRQLREVEKFRHLEKIKLPSDMDYMSISGLSREIREKLNKFRPVNLGQASRISGITPAAISLLMVHLKKING